jgi:NTE family protein
VRTGLVLGAGGTVGIAYHCGVLKALADVAGVQPEQADLLVGTSAGSVVAGLLRSGFDAEDLWQWAQGTHPDLAGEDEAELERRRAEVMVPAFHNPVDAYRRMLGSAWVASRAMARLPTPPVPEIVARMFPAGLMSMRATRQDLADRLVPGWPEADTFIVAVDISSGRRVVFGRPGSPTATLAEAVSASCAIPGVYAPVKIGRRILVDGGVDSTTHLDLAVKAGCKLVIGVVPMAFDTGRPPNAAQQLVRRIPSRWLADEAEYARHRGVEVLLLRPTGDELGIHGYNLMRRDGWERIASAAYDQTVRQLRTARFQSALARVA